MEDAKFSYVHDPSGYIDAHHITLKSRPARLLRAAALLILLTVSTHLFSGKEVSLASCLFSFPVAALLVKVLLSKSVQKESVLIIPDFGVQLETHYRSKVVRRFIPIGKLLQPVLNECVSPITCYWSLSLIVRGEGELLQAFKELRPPVKMLVPIWKGLCSAINNAENRTSTT